MCYQIYIIGCLGLKKDWLNSTEKNPFTMLLFSYPRSCATTGVASTEKDRLERKRLRPFQHCLRDDSFVPPLQQQCNIVFSVKTYSILTASKKKIPVITVVCCLYQKTNNWTLYVKRPCCINTGRSREPVNIMCFQARCLLSNTLCHLTAVLELEELKLFFFPPEEC